MPEPADWDEDGRDWPNRSASRFVDAAGLRWHVQTAGTGPVILLLHGTGASTHSWRGLLPLLAQDFTVVAPDLPGHGFTEAPPLSRLSLPGMAAALAGLLHALAVEPVLAVGHSAGAAIMLRMTLDGMITPKGLVSLNGALLPLQGVPGHLFSPIAKLLARTSLVPRLFAWRARDPALVRRLLHDTGSSIEPAGVELYGRLIQRSGHIAAALGMMANWQLEGLAADLPELAPPLLLVAGGRDRMIPSTHALRVRRQLPGAKVLVLPEHGHLAHEQAPAEIAAIVRGFAEEVGVLAPAPAQTP